MTGVQTCALPISSTSDFGGSPTGVSGGFDSGMGGSVGFSSMASTP